MAIKEVKIEVVLQELGLPENSEFCGYVVHLPNEDEFLAVVNETPDMIQRAFCKTPERAKIYQNRKKAMKDAKHCKQEAIVCLLFDIGKQFVVAAMDDRLE